jgi:hypothetical protein
MDGGKVVRGMNCDGCNCCSCLYLLPTALADGLLKWLSIAPGFSQGNERSIS